MQQLVILLVITCSSTRFGRLYADHQEVRLNFTVYGFLSCCSCCDVGGSDGKHCVESYSTQCTHLATQLSNITTATRGQKTIGSETQSDLLVMGVKMPETC